MKISIVNETTDDFMYEAVKVMVNNKEVAKIETSSESPEDNTCGRMGVNQAIKELINAIDPNISIEEKTLEI